MLGTHLEVLQKYLAVPLYSPLYMVSVRLAPMSMNLMAARALDTALTEARALKYTTV